MASLQRFDAGTAVRRSLPPIHGLGLSSSFFRVSFSGGQVLGLRRFEAAKLSLSTRCANGSKSSASGFEANTEARYRQEEQPEMGEIPNSYRDVEPVKDQVGQIPIQKKRSAKIHDFCLGIPFGGFIFGAGVIGSLISRNPASLATGVLFGGAILALSFCSLKIWRQGKSSLPFILGQAVIASAVLRKNIQSYSLAKSIFPSGLFVVMSAAMICFYAYVLISGGNPPPKKLMANSST